MSKTQTTTASIATNSPEWLAVVKKKVESLSFGIVQIVVHGGRVTQIECTEKTRLDSASIDALLRDNAP